MARSQPKRPRKKEQKTPPRRVFSKENQQPGLLMPRIWEPFGEDAEGSMEACFWGLTYPELVQARKWASKPVLKQRGTDVVADRESDPDLLPFALIVLSARAGDTEEYAADPDGRAKRLLNWPGDIQWIKQNIPGGRINILFEMIDQLCNISATRLAAAFHFFGQVLAFNSGFQNSLLPSLEEALNDSSVELVRESLHLMGQDLKDLSSLAGILLLGSSSPEKSTSVSSRDGRS